MKYELQAFLASQLPDAIMVWQSAFRADHPKNGMVCWIWGEAVNETQWAYICQRVLVKLTELQRHQYAEHLFNLVEGYDDYYEGVVFTEAAKMCFATWQQQAEAIKRTLKK